MHHRLPLAAAAVLAAALAVSTGAFAATPQSGCFGRCGGVPGIGIALMPSLLVQSRRITNLTFPSYCLGHYEVRVTNGAGTVLRTVTWPNTISWDAVSGGRKIPIGPTGAFSYTGRAFLDTSARERLTFTINGRFRTPTLVAGSVSIQSPGCHRTAFAIRNP